MKYIIVNNTMPVIFPETAFHRDAWRFLRDSASLQEWKITGAGYVRMDADGKLQVYGRSEGFDISAKEEDLAILEKAFREGV